MSHYVLVYIVVVFKLREQIRSTYSPITTMSIN